MTPRSEQLYNKVSHKERRRDMPRSVLKLRFDFVLCASVSPLFARVPTKHTRIGWNDIRLRRKLKSDFLGHVFGSSTEKIDRESKIGWNFWQSETVLDDFMLNLPKKLQLTLCHWSRKFNFYTKQKAVKTSRCWLISYIFSFKSVIIYFYANKIFLTLFNSWIQSTKLSLFCLQFRPFSTSFYVLL